MTASKDKPSKKMAASSQAKAKVQKRTNKEKITKDLGKMSIHDKPSETLDPARTPKPRTIQKSSSSASPKIPKRRKAVSAAAVPKKEETTTPKHFSFTIADEEKRLGFICSRLDKLDGNAVKKLTEKLIDALCPKRRGHWPYSGKSGAPSWWPDTRVFPYGPGPHHTDKPAGISLFLFLARLHWKSQDYATYNQGRGDESKLNQGWPTFFEKVFQWRTLEELDVYEKSPVKIAPHQQYLREMALVLRADYEFLHGRSDGKEILTFEEPFEVHLPLEISQNPYLFFRQLRINKVLPFGVPTPETLSPVDSFMLDAGEKLYGVSPGPSSATQSVASPWSSAFVDDSNHTLKIESPESLAGSNSLMALDDNGKSMAPYGMDANTPLEPMAPAYQWSQYDSSRYMSRDGPAQPFYGNYTYAWMADIPEANGQVDQPFASSYYPSATQGTQMFSMPKFIPPHSIPGSIPPFMPGAMPMADTYSGGPLPDEAAMRHAPIPSMYHQAIAPSNVAHGGPDGLLPHYPPQTQDGGVIFHGSYAPYDQYPLMNGNNPKQHYQYSDSVNSGPSASYCTRPFTGHSAGVGGGAHT